MNNKTLLIISLIISIIGIFLLLFISNIVKPKQLNINQINERLLDKKIQVEGKILALKSYDNVKIITMQDKTGKINTAVYTNKKLNLTKNNTIIAIGKVTKYKNTFQIQADKILKI